MNTSMSATLTMLGCKALARRRSTRGKSLKCRLPASRLMSNPQSFDSKMKIAKVVSRCIIALVYRVRTRTVTPSPLLLCYIVFSPNYILHQTPLLNNGQEQAKDELILTLLVPTLNCRAASVNARALVLKVKSYDVYFLTMFRNYFRRPAGDVSHSMAMFYVRKVKRHGDGPNR